MPSEETPAMSRRVVRTVLGDVDPAVLGHCQPHEHIMKNSAGLGLRERDVSPTVANVMYEDITLKNRAFIVRHPYVCLANRRFTDFDMMLEVLQEYRTHGGDAVVDSTPIGLGRDPVGLARLARASGIHIIMGGSVYQQVAHPEWVTAADTDTLTERFIADIETGADGTDVRTGVLGEVGLSTPMHPEEEKVLRATVEAHKQTRAPIQIHSLNFEVAMQGLEIIRDAGGDLTKTIVSHMDSSCPTLEAALEVAQTGAYLEYDQFAPETSYVPEPTDIFVDVMELSDAQRLDVIAGLRDEGYLTRVLIALDLGVRTQLTRYGGDGLQHIIDNVLPLARFHDLSAEEMGLICRTNPSEALSFEPTTVHPAPRRF